LDQTAPLLPLIFNGQPAEAVFNAIARAPELMHRQRKDQTVKAERIHNYYCAKAGVVEGTTVPAPQSDELLVRI
jgi:hypothetical protein